MTRYIRTRLDHLYKNETTALAALNKNFEDIEDAIKDTVSRSGRTPTHMTKELDMNGQRIINLPAPTGDNDAVRKIDVQSTLTEMLNLYTSANALVSAATEASLLAIRKAGEAEGSALNAHTSETKAGEYKDLAKQYADSLDTHQIVHTYEVVDNVTSTSTTFPLSAKQGKLLQDQVNTMKARGTYLSTWNCTTGLANTTPQVVPRPYVTGDYFIVYQTGTVNYKPTGTYYDPDEPSTVVETEDVRQDDTYVFDGTSWSLIHTPRDYGLIELIYPVGSIYIGTTSACPLQALFGTWELVAQDRVLQGAGTRGTVGTTLEESLPNIRGIWDYPYNTWSDSGTVSGAFKERRSSKNAGASGAFVTPWAIEFDASGSSSTYQDNAPVQPNAYLVNIWKRTA